MACPTDYISFGYQRHCNWKGVDILKTISSRLEPRSFCQQCRPLNNPRHIGLTMYSTLNSTNSYRNKSNRHWQPSGLRGSGNVNQTVGIDFWRTKTQWANTYSSDGGGTAPIMWTAVQLAPVLGSCNEVLEYYSLKAIGKLRDGVCQTSTGYRNQIWLESSNQSHKDMWNRAVAPGKARTHSLRI